MISQLFSLRLMGAKVHISLQKKECFQPAFRTEPLLFFAGSWIANSAKEKHGMATTKQNWLQIGYKFEM